MNQRPVHTIPALAALLFLLLGCGGTKSGPAGSYTMDAKGFANTLADQMIKSGQVLPATRALMVAKLQTAVFTVDLAEDGKFKADQRMMGEHHAYIGTWRQEGSSIRLDQTHDNGVEVEDELTGTFAGDTMSLVHKEDGLEVEMVLRRGSAAAPPR